MPPRNWPPTAEYLLDSLDSLALRVTHTLEQTYEINAVDGPVERIIGVSRDELIGPISNWLDRIHPSDRPPTDELFPSSCGETIRTEYRIKTADGRWKHCKHHLHRNDDDRVTIIVKGIAPHISTPSPAEISQELEIAEKRFQAVFEASLDPLLLLDPDGLIVEISRGITALAGWGVGEAVGSHFSEFLRDEDLEEVFRLWKRVVDGESLRAQVKLRHRDGRDIPTELSASSVELDGQPHGVVVIRDLRETIEMRTALENIEQRLARAEKLELLGELAGGIAHDMHNMLTVINGSAEVLLRDAPPESALHDDARAIVAAGKTAAGLSRRLLELGSTSSETRRVTIQDALADLEPFIARIISTDIDYVVDVDPSLPGVDLDGGALEQLLINLLLNARDAVDEGGRIALNARGASSPGQNIVLTIEDDGVGMTPDVVDRIFEPLYTTKGDQGTGLGLSSVARIIEAAGGTKSVESEPGEGTRFVFELPAAEVDSS